MSTESTEQTIDSTSEASAESSPAVTDEHEQHESTPETPEQRRDARTRTRLREVEGERDRLRTALVPHVRAAVEKSVGDRLQDASALWLLPELDPLSMLDDTMSVDDERVSAAVEKLLAHAPALGRRFAGSADGGARSTTSAPSPKWAGLLSPKP